MFGSSLNARSAKVPSEMNLLGRIIWEMRAKALLGVVNLFYTPTVCALGIPLNNCLSTYCKIPPFP